MADIRVSRFEVAETEYLVLSVPTASLPTQRLTSAELQICEALLNGLSNAEIAKLRASAVRTVVNQVASIYRKLGINSRAELAAAFSPA